jgi:hypothetical protein
MRRLINDEFIARAGQVHGDRYDYSRVQYRNFDTKVSIVCREHGPFSTLPGNHLKGKGCPACGDQKRAASKTKSTAKFVSEATSVHKGRYDYSNTKYTGKVHEVTVICPVHGEFRQKAGVHLRGHGCPTCGLLTIGEKKRLTLAEFVAQALAVHGDRYDYSLVDYKGSGKRVTIVCRVHGPFRVPSVRRSRAIWRRRVPQARQGNAWRQIRLLPG